MWLRARFVIVVCDTLHLNSVTPPLALFTRRFIRLTSFFSPCRNYCQLGKQELCDFYETNLTAISPHSNGKKPEKYKHLFYIFRCKEMSYCSSHDRFKRGISRKRQNEEGRPGLMRRQTRSLSEEIKTK